MNNKILILEDEEVLGRIYKKRLEKAGYVVNWCKTAEETELELEHFMADIVLLDHGIKGMEKSGLELIPTVKEHLPNAHVIMLSNYSAEQLQTDAVYKGADAYLIKINTPPKVLVEYLHSHVSVILK
ncbi:MAG: response regulator [Candidatus Gracilibacteria bacterium]|nr:response regulator [Candidatus Gracilibacteria bacterium]